MLANVCGIVLAAGVASRFGSDKRQRQFADGTIMLQRVLDSLKPHCEDVIVVIGQHDQVACWQPVCSGARVLRAEDSSMGMGRSLAHGVQAAKAADGVLVTLADKPFISTNSYRLVRKAMRPGRISVPVCQGQNGHPVGFAALFFDELCALEAGEEGASPTVRKHRAVVDRVAIDDPAVLMDIDTPDDFTALTERFDRSSSTSG